MNGIHALTHNSLEIGSMGVSPEASRANSRCNFTWKVSACLCIDAAMPMHSRDCANNVDLRVEPVYSSAFAFNNYASFTNWQAYVNQRFGFMDDRILVTGGILHYDTKTSGRNLLAGTPASILDDSKDMWMVSALWKIQDNISLYYSHSTNASATIANNVPLWREGVQDEIGFKTEWFERKLSFNAAYFEIEQTNVTTPNPARQTDPTAPEQIVADFGNEGLEFELVGRLTSQLSAIATYSHLKMRDALGRRVRGVADNNAALLLNYRFDGGALSGLALNFGVNYNGRRAGDVPINFTPLGVVGKVSFFLEPAYTTTFGASYRMNERYSFRLIVDNVLDDKGYIAVAGGRVSGTGITTAPGINVKFSTTVEF